MQIGTMRDVALAADAREERVEVDVGELGAASARDAEPPERARPIEERARDADRGEGAHRARQEAEPRADLADARGALEHHGIMARALRSAAASASPPIPAPAIRMRWLFIRDGIADYDAAGARR